MAREEDFLSSDALPEYERANNALGTDWGPRPVLPPAAPVALTCDLQAPKMAALWPKLAF